MLERGRKDDKKAQVRSHSHASNISDTNPKAG